MSETLPSLLAETVARHPESTAIRFEGASLSYAELSDRAYAFARGLVGAGVVKGARVGLLMANRPEWVIAAFGVWLAGGVLVPISTFATPAEREHVLRHADVSVLLLQRKLLRSAYLDDLVTAHPELATSAPGRLRIPALPYLRRVIAFGLDAPLGGVEPWASLAAHGADVPGELARAVAEGVTPVDDAVIVYTSGTTREPKAVLHAHRAPALQARHFSESMGLSPDERMWTTQPFFWVAGLAVSLGAAMVGGATLILDETFDPRVALERIETERVTVLRAWRHQEQAMAEHPDAAVRNLTSLRKLNFSSPLARLVGLTRDEWGTQGGYGLTETFTVVTDLPATAPARLRTSTQGRALPGMEVRILDPQTGAPVAVGREGEIAVRGRTLMRGYLKKAPEEVFDADGFFHTGDGGYLDEDGYLHWTCRLSSLIKTGGANVSPAEVEAVASAQPGIRSAVALGVPHATLGEVLVLCVVPSGEPPDLAALHRAMRERLAAYKVPKHVLVFRQDEIPRTGTEKVRLGVLRDLVEERLAAQSSHDRG